MESANGLGNTGTCFVFFSGTIFSFPTCDCKILNACEFIERSGWTVLQIVSQALHQLKKKLFQYWSKLKAFADDKSNVAEKLEFVLGRVENIVGKGYQHFLLFQ